MPTPTFVSNDKWSPSIEHVLMKARRAKMHLDELERQLTGWRNGPPYTLREKDDFQTGWHTYYVRAHPVPEDIPLLVGDFVCCLRSALDQLAWNLTHLDSKRVFSRKEERDISFLIFAEYNEAYRKRLSLFPTEVARILDILQPYQAGEDYRFHPLWQLNELWNLDKHKIIPSNCNIINLSLPVEINWNNCSMSYGEYIVFWIPITTAYLRETNVSPSISVDLLFGEYMGAFEVSFERLKYIHQFVTQTLIPQFSPFFPRP